MPARRDRRGEILRQNLIRFREERGLSQALAAYDSDVPIHSLRRWEQGKNSVDALALEQLARTYGREVGDFYLENPPPADEAAMPVYFLRIRPGVPLDEDVRADLQARIEAANASHHRGNKTPRKVVKKE